MCSRFSCVSVEYDFCVCHKKAACLVLLSNCYCLLSDIKPSKSEIAAIEIQSLFMFSLLAKRKRGF